MGDCCYPEHIGIFTAPFRVAYQYGISMIVYGENPHLEYGGPERMRGLKTISHQWLQEFQMMGYRLSDLIKNDGFTARELAAFSYPTDEELLSIPVKGVYLGAYLNWDNHDQFEKMRALGFNTNPGGPVEGAYNDYENLDCKWIGGLHDYMKYLKFGYGRATDQLSYMIRSGRVSREYAVQTVGKCEGKIPWKYADDFMQHIGINVSEFCSVLTRFTNRALFVTDEYGNLKHDSEGNPIKKYPIDASA